MVADHFHGRVSATVPPPPRSLVYCEYHGSKADALRRESYFKTTAGKKGLKLMPALHRGDSSSEALAKEEASGAGLREALTTWPSAQLIPEAR